MAAKTKTKTESADRVVLCSNLAAAEADREAKMAEAQAAAKATRDALAESEPNSLAPAAEEARLAPDRRQSDSAFRQRGHR